MNETCSYNTAAPHAAPEQCAAPAARDGLCDPHWRVTKGHHFLPGPGTSGYRCIFCEETAQAGSVLHSIVNPTACPRRADNDTAAPYVYLAPDGGIIPFTKDGTVDEESVYLDANVSRRALLFLMSLMPSCPQCHTTTCFTWAVFWLKEVAGRRGLLNIMAQMVHDLGGSISFDAAALDVEENKTRVLSRQEDEAAGRVEVCAMSEEEARAQPDEAGQKGSDDEWPEFLSGITH